MVKATGELAWDFIKGIWEGIKSAADWLWRKISGFFTGIVDGVKDLLGIHSPSREFADIGKNMSLGLADGIKGSIGLVDRAMDKLEGSVSGIKANLNVNATGFVTAGTPKPVNAVTLNVYANKLDEGQINMLVNVLNQKLGMVY